MKSVLLTVLLVGAAAAQERPNCYHNRLSINGNTANTVRVNANDVNNSATQYHVRVFIDDPTMTSATDFLDVLTTGGTAIFPTSGTIGSTWGTGTKNPNDGLQHMFYMYMISTSNGNVTCTGSGWPYKQAFNGQTDWTYQPITNAVTGATPNNIGVIANTSDTYSTGSTGTPVCTVGGTALYPDGAAGYYIQKYGIPCGHAHVWTVSTAATFISNTAAATAYAALTPALSSSEQFAALAWVLPDQVQFTNVDPIGGTFTSTVSMTGFFYLNGSLSLPMWKLIFTGGQVVQGDPYVLSPYFQSTTANPFTAYGVRPAFMLAGMTCSVSATVCTGSTTVGVWTANFAQFKATIDAGFAARNSIPLNGQIYVEQNQVADFLRSAQYSLTTPNAYGLSPGVPPALNITASNPAFNLVVSLTNILGFTLPAPAANFASTPTFIHSGTAYMSATSSGTGDLTNAGNSTPGALYLNYGAVFSCGTNTEPGGTISTKYPELFLMMSTYTRGDTAIEAAYRATKSPNSTLCMGDPLAQPFGSPASTAGTTCRGCNIKGGVTIRYEDL